MSKEFEDGKWYVAYAVHKWADIEDIDSDCAFDTEEDAEKYASYLLCDDDDTKCFLRKDGEWFSRELVKTGIPLIYKYGSRDCVSDAEDGRGIEVLSDDFMYVVGRETLSWSHDKIHWDATSVKQLIRVYEEYVEQKAKENNLEVYDEEPRYTVEDMMAKYTKLVSEIYDLLPSKSCGNCQFHHNHNDLTYCIKDWSPEQKYLLTIGDVGKIDYSKLEPNSPDEVCFNWNYDR